jgi:hypothetical protein
MCLAPALAAKSNNVMFPVGKKVDTGLADMVQREVFVRHDQDSQGLARVSARFPRLSGLFTMAFYER